jgi:formate dehydrogenase major subunit
VQLRYTVSEDTCAIVTAGLHGSFGRASWQAHDLHDWISMARERLPVLGSWPVVRQIATGDVTGLGDSARSRRSDSLRPRTETADRVVRSVCPYCAVGCGQLVYVKDEKITDIEGDPDSPISEGCLCPKGAATMQLVTGDHRTRHVLYRRPGGTAWEQLPLELAMDMVAARVQRARDARWQETLPEAASSSGERAAARTLSIAHLGGATLDNEENYLLKKLYTALGIIQVENQARI